MESVIIIELVLTAVVTIVLAAILGYLGQKLMGAAILGGGATVASAMCLAGAWAGYELGEDAGTWIGLLLGILLSGMLGAMLLGGFIRSRNRRFLVGAWYAYCALCIAGHLGGGWIGLLTITLPAVIIFWIGLYRLSAHILPLRGRLRTNDGKDRSSKSAQHTKRDREERFQAFKSLITFSLGTNYPYYFVKDGKAEKRVEGNPAGRFFAGPGFVYTDCSHAAYVTSGILVRGVLEPGLNFTGLFDLEPKIIDLRPQLRAFPVDALTTDGIPIQVLAFAIFQIHPGHKCADLGETAELRKPKLGQPFPFRHRAVYDAIAGEPVEMGRRKELGGEKHEWDGTLVSKIAAPIIQDIISRYSVDELCAAYDPGSDPRTAIIHEMQRRLRRAVRPYGIHLLGGAIGNLEPLDPTVKERRVENWKTEWERQVLLRISEGKAERTRQIERARAAAEAEIVLRLGQVVEASASTAFASQTALALRFIDCLGEMISESDTQWPLPDSIENTLKRLRGEIDEGPR